MVIRTIASIIGVRCEIERSQDWIREMKVGKYSASFDIPLSAKVVFNKKQFSQKQLI